MKKPWLIGLTMLLFAAAGLIFVLRTPVPAASAPAAASASAAAAATSPPGQLRFPANAPQLAMIHSQLLPAVGMPLGDTLSGRLVYDEDATARILPPVAGRVVAIRVAQGERVHRGQLLAELDAPELGAAIADLDKARADEARKRQALERAQALVGGEGIAARDIEAAQADLAQARAETVRASQRLHNLSPDGMMAHGQRLLLTSPIDGVVVERAVTPALEVSTGGTAPLFVISNLKQLSLLIDVPESMAAQIRRGAAVDVESEAFPGRHFKASVVQPGQVIDPNTRRVLTRAALDNADGKLLPEMFVRCAVLQTQGSAVKVPNSALVNSGLYTYLFVETAPGQFQRRQVSMLSRGGETSYLGQGVSGGERIVTAGALLLDAEMGNRAGGAP